MLSLPVCWLDLEKVKFEKLLDPFNNSQWSSSEVNYNPTLAPFHFAPMHYLIYITTERHTLAAMLFPWF